MMWTASYAWNGFYPCGLGPCDATIHVLGHSLSNFYDTPHGAAMSVTIPATMRYFLNTKTKKFAEFAREVFKVDEPDDLKAAQAGIDALSADGAIVRSIISAGVPVIGHIGVTKQKIVRAGRIQLPAQNANSAREIIADAVEMANSGVFALVLECLPIRLAEALTKALEIPTIGIGSGMFCDGQALVTQDMLGLYKEMSPRFLKVYADLTQAIVTALTTFRQEVEGGVFPTAQHSYSIEDAELGKLLAQFNV